MGAFKLGTQDPAGSPVAVGEGKGPRAGSRLGHGAFCWPSPSQLQSVPSYGLCSPFVLEMVLLPCCDSAGLKWLSAAHSSLKARTGGGRAWTASCGLCDSDHRCRLMPSQLAAHWEPHPLPDHSAHPGLGVAGPQGTCSAVPGDTRQPPGPRAPPTRLALFRTPLAQQRPRGRTSQEERAQA